MFGLIDCNNFYASCERVFRPDLRNQPVAILSNNDGCIIARSNEVKALDIPMGAPLFKYEARLKEHKVHIFSANFALYGDMSHRVMNAIGSFVPAIEIYSIDEAFVDLNRMDSAFLKKTAYDIHKCVPKWTGIPVGIGIGPTKVLAKVANHYSKKLGRPVILETPHQIEVALQKIGVGEIWGIGRQMKKHLNKLGIQSAYDFAHYDPKTIKTHFSVVIQRLQNELNAQQCLTLEDIQPKKEICTSRSFGKRLNHFADIFDALAIFTQISAEKLRAQDSFCEQMCVFIHTDPFNEHKAQYAKNTIIRFAPTNSSNTLISLAKTALHRVYQEGYEFKKAGVILQNISQAKDQQNTLFETAHTTNTVMEAIDEINSRYGAQTIGMGLFGARKSAWGMNQNNLSQRYTTALSDLIEVV